MKQIKRNCRYGMVLLATITVLHACRVPQYARNEMKPVDRYRNQEEVQERDSSIAKISYRDFFKDEILISLLDSALKKNNDLNVALKQIEFASEGYKQAKWLNVPLLNANLANVGINRPSDNSMNGMMASQFMGQKYNMDYTSSIQLSWEADIWGKLKGQKQEVLVDFLKTQEAARAIKTRLVAEVVQGYYNLLLLDRQLEITKRNLGFADSTLFILNKQVELGLTNILSVQQQEVARDQVAKQIPAIEARIHVQENALSILVGEVPGPVKRTTRLDQVQSPTNLSLGVPANLLSYRPDLRSSELDVRRSLASIHIARASMYPNLNITAQGGLNAFKANNWFNLPGSLFAAATGTIVQPILNGRQLKTRLEQSKITKDQMELNFKQTMLKAVGEVSDALIQLEKSDEQLETSNLQVERSAQLVQNALLLYKFNEATYLEVIVAQTNRLQAELDQATVKSQKINAITSLYRALGGGWL
ncbi:TolC family protein [Sphingobacterium athyrii]|uniref:RND transporter n=1 Tax=Sphingobacterium athyrii TaxID=2152717 RepID=A0A363NY99_9SPHI|nr:TolC family protein [Sphingobacterium athyrii]PUV25782.1 RND transporter [Sphingobacterium athyrii]